MKCFYGGGCDEFYFCWRRKCREYVRHDWHSNRVRFCAEVMAWACSVVSAIMFAATVPNIPVVPLYSNLYHRLRVQCLCLLHTQKFWPAGQFGIPDHNRWYRT
jgi:hypothetical protein